MARQMPTPRAHLLFYITGHALGEEGSQVLPVKDRTVRIFGSVTCKVSVATLQLLPLRRQNSPGQ